MAHLLRLLLLSSILSIPAQAQRRTIMEGLAAGNTAIYVSTVTGGVYVRTAGTMTVAGNAFSVGISTLVVVGGKVSVGITNPTTLFQVEGTPADPTLNDGGYLSVGSAGYRTIEMGGYLNSPYVPYIQSKYTTGSTLENLAINPLGGYVGIAKASPTTALDVTGTVTATAFAGDGSALTGIVAAVATSTRAVRMADIGWGTVLLVCKSTLTISGSTFTIHATINHLAPGAATFVSGYLVDGGCPTGHVCSTVYATARTPCRDNGNGTYMGCTINAREVLSNASHTFCVYSGNNNGATTTSNFLDFWVEAN